MRAGKIELIKEYTPSAVLRQGLIDAIVNGEAWFTGGYSPKCHDLKPRVFFLYRDSNFYMRTPSITNSADLVPMLRVLRNPKYAAYMDIYILKAEHAKKLIEGYAHRGGRSVRSRLREEVEQWALRYLNRTAFVEMETALYDEEDWMLNTLMELFPCEQILDIAVSVKASRDINRRSNKTFLRNNTTDQTI